MNAKHRLALLLGAFILAGCGAVIFTSPSVGASFTAADVQTTTHDGQIDAVTIAPEGRISWTGLEQEPSKVAVSVEVKTEDGWKTVDTRTYRDVKGLDGSHQYDFSTRSGPIDLTTHAFSATEFAASDGETVDTTVDVRITVTVHGQEERSTSVSDSFQVTVENKRADADASGSANTGVSSNSEVSG